MQYYIAFAVGIFALLSPLTSLAHSPEFHETPSDTAFVITITDNGYMPQHPVVEVGVEVIFENKSTSAKWPASNFHPTHTEYPVQSDSDCLGSSFDACRPLAPGESWWFVFDKIGEWGFHDHLFPGMTGSITVVERKDLLGVGIEEESQKTFKTRPDNLFFIIADTFGAMFEVFLTPFKNLDSQHEILRFRTLDSKTQLEIIREKAAEDPASAWDFVKRVGKENGEVILNGHEMAHVVGNALYERFGLEGVVECDITFAFGCFHGVTEQMFAVLGPKGLDEVKVKCKELFTDGDEFYQEFGGCVHGAGHGLLTYHAYDLEKTLRDCDSLGIPHNRYCADGAYMEYSFSGPLTAEVKEDPWILCSAAQGTAMIGSCAQYIPVLAGRYSLGRYPSEGVETLSEAVVVEAVDACESAGNQAQESECAHALGQLFGQHSKLEPSIALDRCEIFNQTSSERQCIHGAAMEFAAQNYQNWRENMQLICAHQSADTALCVGGSEKIWNRLHGNG